MERHDRANKRLAAIVAGLAMLTCATAVAMEPVDLNVAPMGEPTGIDDPTPTLRWSIRAEKNDIRPRACSVRIASRPELLQKQKNMVVVCGDRHWQYVSRDAETGVLEFSCGPGGEGHAGGWKQEDVRPEHLYLNVCGGFLEGAVDRGCRR